MSKWGFLHTSFNAPIATVAAAIHAVISASSRRRQEAEVNERAEIMKSAACETDVSVGDPGTFVILESLL